MKNSKSRILIPGSLYILTLFLFIHSRASVLQGSPTQNIIADTLPCKLVPINEPDFKAVLDKRATVSNGLYDFVNADTSSYSITYIQYVRSSGQYLGVRIITDSSGNYLTSEIKYSDEIRGFSKRFRKEIENLKVLDYTDLLENKDFKTSNCYISDGAELFVFARIRGKLANGLTMVGVFEEYKLNKSEKQFIAINNRIFRTR